MKNTSSSIVLSSGVVEGSVFGPSFNTLKQAYISRVMDMVQKTTEEDQVEVRIKTFYHVSCDYADDVSGCAALNSDEDAQLASYLIMSISRRATAQFS